MVEHEETVQSASTNSPDLKEKEGEDSVVFSVGLHLVCMAVEDYARIGYRSVRAGAHTAGSR